MPILIIEISYLEQVHYDANQDQGNIILNNCVCVNCQEFGHIISIRLSGKIFTLVGEEDKLFKKQKVIYDEVGELIDCKDFSCVNQGLIEEQHK